MKLTMIEVLDAHQGLPALADKFLKGGNVKGAIEVAQAVRALTPTVEVFNITQAALLNAHGTVDKAGRQTIMAGTEGEINYRNGQMELLAQEFDVDVSPIPVTADDLQSLDVTMFLKVTPLVELCMN